MHEHEGFSVKLLNHWIIAKIAEQEKKRMWAQTAGWPIRKKKEGRWGGLLTHGLRPGCAPQPASLCFQSGLSPWVSSPSSHSPVLCSPLAHAAHIMFFSSSAILLFIQSLLFYRKTLMFMHVITN